MTEKVKSGLRERTRQAVRGQIAEAARALCVERGYEAVTIADIADAVGMSQRSVFRYFPAKEELLLGKLDHLADEMLEELRTRPADEPVWQSLRVIFELLVLRIDGLDKDSVAAPMQRVIFTAPNLLGRYLEKQIRLQDAVATALIERSAAAGTTHPAQGPTLRALTGAAFGCLNAAQQTWLESGANDTLAAALDKAMSAVTPHTDVSPNPLEQPATACPAPRTP
ncbi:TetR family transcriptional regulator [Streptomyces sp. NPDC008092]|uniref:TetR/AcrR family transcriptional regulator n=1 Tax=Streptomyces sp. NPDC008092 TaxID=3364808 RepID=UPI0036E34CDA